MTLFSPFNLIVMILFVVSPMPFVKALFTDKVVASAEIAVRIFSDNIMCCLSTMTYMHWSWCSREIPLLVEHCRSILDQAGVKKVRCE